MGHWMHGDALPSGLVAWRLVGCFFSSSMFVCGNVPYMAGTGQRAGWRGITRNECSELSYSTRYRLAIPLDASSVARNATASR